MILAEREHKNTWQIQNIQQNVLSRDLHIHCCFLLLVLLNEEPHYVYATDNF
jgi:predicted dehydrogenase